jgi:hypothetical protein
MLVERSPREVGVRYVGTYDAVVEIYGNFVRNGAVRLAA